MLKKKTLIFGGLYQGKHKFIHEEILSQANFYEVQLEDLLLWQRHYFRNRAIPESELKKLFNFNNEKSICKDKVILFFDFTKFPWQELNINNLLTTEFWQYLLDCFSNFTLELNLVFCLRELGSTLLPLDKDERVFIECHGRLLQYLCSESDTVIRVIAGLKFYIKE